MAFLAEWLEIGGFSLSTPGWTHLSIAPLLSSSDVRTGGRVVPGGRGYLPYPIRTAASRRVLELAIFGDVDGAGNAHPSARLGVEANLAAIIAAIVEPPDPVLAPDGTREAVLHTATGDRTARVRVIGPLTPGPLGPAGYTAPLDLEFPYGLFAPPAAPTAPVVTVTATGYTTVTLSWPSAGGAYAIESAAAVGGPFSPLASGVTALTYTDTGRTPGTTRYYRVIASNVSGSATSAVVSGTTPATTTPGAPTANGVSRSDASGVTVSWFAPADDGGSPITGYRIRSVRVSDGTVVATDTVASTVRTFTKTGLAAGVPVQLKVAATNAPNGYGPDLVSASATPLGVPGAPTGVAATAGPGAGQLTVTAWTAPAGNGGSPITGYTVNVYNGATLVNTFGPYTAAPAGPISGLTAIPYTVKVAAINAVGTGPESAASAAVTPPGTGAPTNAPTGLTAAQVSNGGSAVLTWTAPTADSNEAPTGYSITSYVAGVAETVRVTPTNATTFTFTPVTNGTTYTFKVAAINAAGTGPQSAASATFRPGTPSAPATPVATAQAGAVGYAFTLNAASEQVTTYTVRVYRASDNVLVGSAGGVTTGTGSVAATSGVAVYVKAQASNIAQNGAESAASNTVTPTGSATTYSRSAAVSGVGSVTVARVGAFAKTAAVSGAGTASTSRVLARKLAGAVSGVGAVAVTKKINRAATVSGVGVAAMSKATVGRPGTPTSIVATGGAAQVAVSWNPPASNGGSALTGYDVELIDATTGIPVTGLVVSAATTSRTFTGVAAGDYYCTVAAQNVAGLGTAGTSNTVTAT